MIDTHHAHPVSFYVMTGKKVNLSLLIIHSSRGIAWTTLSPAYRYAAAQPVTQPTANFTGGYTNFDPSMTIIIMVLLFSFSFIVMFSIYLHHCAGATTGDVLPSRAAIDVSRKRGLDPAVIDTFPTFIYCEVKDLKLGRGALECAVCLSEFEDDETLRLIPKCDHVFHPECIDTWLGSHSTCPVCRANLTPELNETAKLTESNNELNDNQNQNNSVSEPGPVVIDINDEQSSGEVQVQVVDTANRKDVLSLKFPRSHSTGHSLAQAGINVERYTLRLPEEIRKQIIMREKLKRTQSFNVILAREGSSRKGIFRSGGEGSSRGRSYVNPVGGRSERWVLSMTPPFVSKVGSVNSVKAGDGEGDGSSNGRTLLTAVKVPLNCLNVKVDPSEESSSSGPRIN